MKATAVVLTLFFLTVPQSAQQVAVMSEEKCTIQGLVVDAITGQPLKRVQISLNKVAEGNSQPRNASTDAHGHFAVDDLEPGRYSLWVNRNGYVAQAYGQRGPNRPGTLLSLAQGQHLKDLVFRLTRTAVISGLITDEDGEPLIGVNVQALRYSYMNGRRQLSQTGGTSTNDLGEYRLAGLATGRYYVSATYLSGNVGETAEEGYVPFYYPGTSDPDGATEIELRPGDGVVGIDITLSPVHTVRVRGRITDAITGKPARDVNVWLAGHHGGVSFSAGQVSMDNAKGTFEIRGVPPGSYTLSAQVWNNPYLNKPLVGHEQLEVGETDVEDVNLVIGPGVEVSGRVRAEGDAALSFSNLRFFLQPRDDVMMMSTQGDSVKPDGTFILKDIPEGAYSIHLFGAPEDFYLKSARQGGQDVLNVGLSIKRAAAAGTLELTLSSGGGQIDGVVLNQQQQPFAGATVALVPEPNRRGQTRLYMNGNSDEYGRFTLRGVTPGDYKLFAWEEVEGDAYENSDFLRPYEHRGKPVHVDEAARLNVQLQLIPVAEGSP